MRKLLLTTVIFLCLIQGIVAVNSGEPYIVFNEGKCYGPVTIKVRGEQNFTIGEYNLAKFKKAGFDKKDEIWKYTCNNKIGENINIILNTNNKTKNSYTIRLQYYIGPYLQPGDISDKGLNKNQMENHNNERTKTFTNIRFGPAPFEKKPFKWPAMPGGNIGKWSTIIVILLIALFIIGGGFYLFYRIFFKDDEEVVSEATLSGNMQEPTDEEVLEYIRNNTG